MKFGVNTMVWTTQVGEKQDPLFARIKEWGFGGVEPFLSPDEPANIPALKATLDRLQLERTTCCVLPRDANLVSYDALSFWIRSEQNTRNELHVQLEDRPDLFDPAATARVPDTTCEPSQ